MISETTLKDEAVFKYFATVSQACIEQAKESDKVITENVLRQLNKIMPHPDKANGLLGKLVFICMCKFKNKYQNNK